MEYTINNNVLNIQFREFDISNYQMFLKTKKIPEAKIDYDLYSDSYSIKAPARFAKLLGIDFEPEINSKITLPEFLFDYQKYIIKIALDTKRYACYADTGLGKTLIFLSWALNVKNFTNGKILILSPLQVINQTIEQAYDFFGSEFPIKCISDKDELKSFCLGSDSYIAITNYDKFRDKEDLNYLQYLDGIAADESSIFKNGGGVIKWNIVKNSSNVEYKLSCTATPAPNDLFEYSSQLSFLFRDRMNVLTAFWKHFTKNKKGEWRVKPHSLESLYNHMTSWSIYLRNPKTFGFKDNDTSLIPEPIMFEYPLEMTKAQIELMNKINLDSGMGMFGKTKIGVVTRSKFSQIAKGFIYTKDKKVIRVESNKLNFVSELAIKEIQKGYKLIIWTVFDEESIMLLESILKSRPSLNIKALSGKTKTDERIKIIDDFRHGDLDCIISKPVLLGFGLNFQVCKSMIFSGWDDSYERWYQAIRRAYRYGQKDSIRVHVSFIPELEGTILENIIRKKDNFSKDASEQEKAYAKIMKEII